MQVRNGVKADDILPEYSIDLPAGEQTLESMEMDDEAISGIHGNLGITPFGPSWSFAGVPEEAREVTMAGMTQMTAVPPGSDQEGDEDLFDGASNKAASTAGPSDDEGTRILTDFPDDPGTTHGGFGTPQISREGTPVQDVPPLLDLDEGDDGSVTDIHLHENVYEME